MAKQRTIVKVIVYVLFFAFLACNTAISGSISGMVYESDGSTPVTGQMGIMASIGDPDVQLPITISPEAHAFFRKATNGVHHDLTFVFEVAGGVPISGGLFGDESYYLVEVVGGRLSSPETGYAFEDETGAFRYWFETYGKEDGIYFIRAKDRLGVQVVSNPLYIHTISVNEVASTWADAGSACILSISNTESPYVGSSIAVPAGANSQGMRVSFCQVESGAPFVSGNQALADLIHLEATDDFGDPVILSTPAVVTFSYLAMIGNHNPLSLAVIHYNETVGRWERVTPLAIDLITKTVSFQTADFSLFGVVVPVESSFTLMGGSSQNDFYMTSVPGQALGANFRDHLEEFLDGYNDTLWRLFAYDPQSGGYVEATDANFSRFNDEFGLIPGRGFWLISRRNSDVVIPCLSFDEALDSVFHTILYPGWNMVSHPWAGPIDLNSHGVEVSSDGATWYSIDSAQNSFTDGFFWRFLRHEGSPGNWYGTLSLAGSNPPPGPPPGQSTTTPTELSALIPYESYWLKNHSEYPVFLRMIKRAQTVSLGSSPVPGHLRMLAVRWIQKALFSIDRSCVAQSVGGQPPDPPTVDSERRTIGVASGGGGGCFIETASGETGRGKYFIVTILFGLLAAVSLFSVRRLRGDAES